ncbi:hypothetical protein OS493_008477 [Desmophyllum pertusum]|uniref:Uncharacterized protein n=1 Tax=Desmophyllum pertusum TaxID=174260 RepID=A0A9W9ZR54_9CNID|nr:hypothetical protein OS493_008477 [Desmophyllum pertusum]
MEAKFERADSSSESSFVQSASASSVSLTNTPKNRNKLEEHTAEGKLLIRNEILRIVTSLSSIVASRAHQEELVK